MSDDIRQPPAAWFTHPEPNPLDVPNQAVIWHSGHEVWFPVSLRYLKETAAEQIVEDWQLEPPENPAGDPMAIADYVVWGGPEPQWPEPELTFKTVSGETVSPKPMDLCMHDTQAGDTCPICGHTLEENWRLDRKYLSCKRRTCSFVCKL